jgi:hypothetical protein
MWLDVKKVSAAVVAECFARACPSYRSADVVTDERGYVQDNHSGLMSRKEAGQLGNQQGRGGSPLRSRPDFLAKPLGSDGDY